MPTNPQKIIPIYQLELGQQVYLPVKINKQLEALRLTIRTITKVRGGYKIAFEELSHFHHFTADSEFMIPNE